MKTHVFLDLAKNGKVKELGVFNTQDQAKEFIHEWTKTNKMKKGQRIMLVWKEHDDA